MRADLLASTPDGVDEAFAAIDAFDQALTGGLLRLQPAQAAGLTQLAEAVANTPLASRGAEAAEKAAAGVAAEDHFVALAAARTALLGAIHDALMAQVQEATGRSASAPEAAPATRGEAAKNLLTAARSWLSGQGIALLAAHPATCDAVASLLGCEGTWQTAATAPSGADGP